MTAPRLLTYYDAMAAGMDFVGGNATSAGQADIRRCVLRAYDEVGSVLGWGGLTKRGRIHLVAPYSTGTITYDHTGGSSERILTLADGTWPDDAIDYVVLIDNIESHIESVSGLVATLDAVMNPGADVDAGTSYSTYPRYYPLPWDFEDFYGPWTENIWRKARQVSYDELLGLSRSASNSGTTAYYAVREVADMHNQMGLYIHPPSDDVQTLDFIYKRKPRQLRHTGHDAADIQNTITTDGTTTVVGNSTAFSSTMVGAVLRIGDDTYVPTAQGGVHSYLDERIITARASATSLTVDAAMSSASTKKYCITDPIDLPENCWEAFTASVNKQLATQRNMKNKADFFGIYKDALFRAKGTNNRSRQRAVAGNRPIRHRHRWDTTGVVDVG